MTIRRLALVTLAAALSASLTMAVTTAPAKEKPPQLSGPVKCSDLKAELELELSGNPGIKSLSVAKILANAANKAYCQVDVVYSTSPEQNIAIRIGLPLNSLDEGTGGIQGAWNGRTQGVGGGGCAGSRVVNPPVNAGYVGSGTDTGHTGGDCEPGVNLDGTYNLQFIEDFIRNAIKQQILLSKSIARAYYGMAPRYDYWNGCSTGGRQGYLLAQELGEELDGILANAPAMYWTRFQTAQMWGQIVMKELVGGPIVEEKLNQATVSAIKACDAADGVTDGVIDDPRTCHFSATANICGAPTAPATNCLTPQEAQAIDMIWDGPRNAKGEKIWFGLDRGTQLGGSCIPGFGCFSLNGTVPFALGVTQFHWDEHDRTFDWKTVGIHEYAQVAQDGSRNIADVTDTFGDLDVFRRHGGKLLTFVGGNDQLIMPRGVINYYRQMASRFGKGQGKGPDFESLQSFYRLFRAPGVGHCGGGSGPQPQNLFDALVNWVENGSAPDQILAQTAGGAVKRPLCPYPQTAIYDGGDQNVAASFHCGGNLEAPEVVCADVLAKYKHEEKGPLDFSGSGVNRHACLGGGDQDQSRSRLQ